MANAPADKKRKRESSSPPPSSSRRPLRAWEEPVAGELDDAWDLLRRSWDMQADAVDGLKRLLGRRQSLDEELRGQLAAVIALQKDSEEKIRDAFPMQTAQKVAHEAEARIAALEAENAGLKADLKELKEMIDELPIDNVLN
ncbi:hypothetical protein ANO11243_019050 [Dothideomycetidae sp. 11243]|nr:hypothetical protein ANO11243_019050 [fungal sp. No.11243]